MPELDIPVGRIEGRAEIRDKNGNLKGSFTFGGDSTKEVFDEINKSVKGDDNGSNTDHSGP